MKKPKFKARYVLGEGYVWFPGGEIQLYPELTGSKKIKLKLPCEIESIAEGTPKYRLVLERIK